jgi:lipoprotein signal peptidase
MPRLSLRNFRSPAAVSFFLLTAVLGLTLDLWTKKVAFERLAPWGVEHRPSGAVVVRIPENESPPIRRFLPGWVNFQAMVNQGAVFGIGQGKRALFLTVSVAAILFIFYLFLTSDRQPFYQFVLGLLLAGVLGNLYDRLVLGYVRDMIYIFPGRIVMGREVFPWIFNVADSLLCVGVAMIFLYSLRGQPKKATEPAKEPGAEGAAPAH